MLGYDVVLMRLNDKVFLGTDGFVFEFVAVVVVTVVLVAVIVVAVAIVSVGVCEVVVNVDCVADFILVVAFMFLS